MIYKVKESRSEMSPVELNFAELDEDAIIEL